MHDGRLDGIARSIEVADAFGGHVGELAVFQYGDVARCLDDRDDIGCHIGALFAICQDDGGILAGDHDSAGFLRAYRSDAVGAHDPAHRVAQGLHQIALARIALAAVVGLFDKVGDHFGVGLAGEHMTAG